MMAARIKQFQAFMALTQMLVMPLFFLSGALYPLNGLPAWRTVLTRIDPLTYVVDPMRRAVCSHLTISPAALHALAPGVSWGGWVVPLGLSLGIVALMGSRWRPWPFSSSARPVSPILGQTSEDSTLRPKSVRNPHYPHPLINSQPSRP